MSDGNLIVSGGGDRPQVLLEYHQLFCGRHLAPFRHKWPTGYPTAALIVWQRVLDIPEFAAACGGAITKGPELLKLKPACCRLDRDVLLAVYRAVQEQCHVWTLGRCRICKRRNTLGGPMQDQPRPNATRTIAHLCLKCVVFGEMAPTGATQ